MIILCLIALVTFHVFVYIWVNYMIVIIELCFTSVYGKKNQLVWLSERRVLKLRLLRVVTPKVKSI